MSASRALGYARTQAESLAPALWPAFAYCPFLGTTGRILPDYSGGYVDGLYSDVDTSLRWGWLPNGAASLAFTGVDVVDYGLVSRTAIDFTESFTVVAVAQVGGGGTLCAKRDGNTVEFQFYVDTGTGTLNVRIGGTVLQVDAADLRNDGRIHVLAVTCTGADIYATVDGRQGTPAQPAPAIVHEDIHFSIGARWSTYPVTGFEFTGDIQVLYILPGIAEHVAFARNPFAPFALRRVPRVFADMPPAQPIQVQSLAEPVYLVQVDVPQFFEFFILEDQSGTPWYYWFTAGGSLAFSPTQPTHPILPSVDRTPLTGNPASIATEDETSAPRYLYPRNGFGELLGSAVAPGGVEWAQAEGLTLTSLGFDARYTLRGSAIQPWAVTAEPVAPQTVHFSAGDRFPVYNGILWRARLRAIASISTELRATEGQVGGAAFPRLGSLIVDIADGTLDALTSLPWDGRPVRLWRGLRGGDFATTFEPVLETSVTQTTWTTDTLVFTLADPAAKTRQNIQQALYAGTGLLEGGPNLAGRPKPLSYGFVRNVRPTLVDTASLVYQVHDGSVFSIDAVFDRAVPLTFAGNVPDVYAWVPVAGQYVTDVARGVFRLGALASGQITADVHGDNTGGYVSSSARIMERILLTRAGLLPAEIDSGAFNTYNMVFPADANVYLDAATSIASVMTSLATGAVWGYTQLGLVTVRQLSRVGMSAGTIREENLVSDDAIQRIPSPVPPWRLSLGYARSWLVQPEEQVAPAASAAQREFVSVSERLASAQSTVTREVRLLARDIERSTQLDNQADAEAESSRELALLGESPNTYSVTIRPVPFVFAFGEIVTLQHSRFGLQLGRDVLVIGISSDIRIIDGRVQEQIRLTLWG